MIIFAPLQLQEYEIMYTFRDYLSLAVRLLPFYP